MTFSAMTNALARTIFCDKAYNDDHRFIHSTADLTEYDNECIDLYAHNLRNLFMRSNGRMWDDVLKEIKKITYPNAYIGFNAQQKVIDTCKTYGMKFYLKCEV